MADHTLSKLLETQISLTEWLAKIGHKDAKQMREEDNIKRVRLGQISEVTGLPYDKPTSFDALEITKKTPKFKQFLHEHGDELCALRLMPKKGEHVEKLRNRGKSIRDAVEWFDSLDIDPAKYNADFVPHINDYSWATIFVVNDHGIFGEIYKGGHHILTQGLYEGSPPILFGCDFKSWQLDPPNKSAQDYLKILVEYLHVPDPKQQAQLKEAVGAQFVNGYMKGYFESTHSEVAGTWFIDYNRLLGDRYNDYQFQHRSKQPTDVIQGRVASSGVAAGKVHIVHDPLTEDIEEGEILVCEMTTPDYIPLMVKAAGIVTDQGGILCHAAIVARELGKPCIVGTGNATELLKTGDEVVLDLVNGVVTV